jgi:signal transduction histidine kinase
MDAPDDDRPLHDMEAFQISEERHSWIFFAVLATLLMIGGFIVFLSAYMGQIKPGLDRGIILGLNATTLALILTCAYFFAFRFFDDLFYLFVAIGWLANACYLPFEFLFVSNCTPGDSTGPACFEFSLYTYALSFVSSVSFYMSTRTKPSDTSSYSVWTILGFWLISIAAITAGCYGLINYVWPTSDLALKFAVYAIPGALFSAYSLFRVGQHITGALKRPKMGSDQTLGFLSFSFYLYAVLQLTYPFKLYLYEANVSRVFFSFFIVAFASKSTNVYCLIKLLLTVKYPEFVQAKSELAAIQERLNQQSQLAALGAIAASIEHDMKTPLAGISTKLETMRRLFSDDKVRWYIEKLEDDKNRIAAIAKVVPYMRGGEEFYDRDKFMGKVSANEVILQAIKSVKVEMSLDTKKFFFPVNPDVKPSQRNIEYFVRAYPPMLEQMVVNLFKNGIEAIREAKKDGGVITTRVTTIRAIPDEVAARHELKKLARWVRVEIEDNGCGIPAENIPKLTSLFTTKHDRKANGGIGLYIARHHINIHEGGMEISSVVGKGTTVTIYLPEWEAYQNYVLAHPEEVKQSKDFNDGIGALNVPMSQRRETPAIVE